MQLVRDDAAMESIIAKVMELQNKENTNIPLYEKQLRDAESGIQNMLNAIQAGIQTSSTKERLEQLEETKRELEARIAEEKLAKPKVTEEFIRFWLLRFRKLDMSLKDQRQALVDTFINAIYLYDDKVGPASFCDLWAAKQIVRDCDPIRNGKLYADRAYIDADWQYEMKKLFNIDVVTPRKKKKDEYLISGDAFSTSVSSVRQPIESFFNWLNVKTSIQKASHLR